MIKIILGMLVVSITLFASDHGAAPEKTPMPVIKKDPKESPIVYVCKPTKPHKQVKQILIKGLFPGNSVGNEYLNYVVVEGKHAFETVVSAQGTQVQRLLSDGPEKLALEVNASDFPKVSGSVRFTAKTGVVETKLNCVCQS